MYGKESRTKYNFKREKNVAVQEAMVSKHNPNNILFNNVKTNY